MKKHKRTIPELKVGNVVHSIMTQFKIYDDSKGNNHTTRERDQDWKRGYICALLDTRQITEDEWDEAVDLVNCPKEDRQ